MNATVRNNIVSNMVGTNGEAILMATVEHW
jgi:hypothetical protein